jgi:hypothetical protein
MSIQEVPLEKSLTDEEDCDPLVYLGGNFFNDVKDPRFTAFNLCTVPRYS